jgi:deoxyadenosine/deoxycytidine kinase
VRVEIAGAIAVGKTSVTAALAHTLPSALAVEEDVTTWHFLPRFYDDQARWAFHSRIELLSHKAQRWADTPPEGAVALYDRGLHELITFARVLARRGALSPGEIEVYERLYGVLVSTLPRPDRIVWVRCEPEESLRRIAGRGRPFERGIQLDYLQELDREYKAWLQPFPSDSTYVHDTSTGSLEALVAWLEAA